MPQVFKVGSYWVYFWANENDPLEQMCIRDRRMLEEQIPQKEQRLAQLQAREANVDAFIEKAKQYTAIDTLTPELLRLFIQRIEVGERETKYSRNSSQSVRIIYRDIGTVDSAMQPDEKQPKLLPPLSEVIQFPA